MNAFVKDISEYKREYDIEAYAQTDLAFYLSRMENIAFEEAVSYTKWAFSPEGIYKKKDPELLFLERFENGDRDKRTMLLSEYLGRIRDEGLILAPSGTAYIPPSQKKSVLGEYINQNMLLRKHDKGEMFLASMRHDLIAEAYFNTLQTSRKIKNNSLSGMHANPSTPWYNPTSHSTLTSTCRCATSYANAGNEKFLGGLRHYYTPNMVIYHILVAAQHTDIEKLIRVTERYNLHLPTAEECMMIVRYSTQYYWHNPNYEKQIFDLLDRITPYERAAFAYTGDLYHLDKYNSDFVKHFLKDYGHYVTGTCEDPKKLIKSLDDNTLTTACYLSAPVIKGISLKDAELQRPEAYHAVALTGAHLNAKMNEYQEFIEVIIRQDYLPLSITAFPTSARHSVPTSDTDSTIFTVQHWVHKYGGEAFSHEAMSIQYFITYLIAGMTENTLKLYSANLGVEKEHMNDLEMKNEYIFPTYSLTALAKHYYAYQAAREGNVFSKNKTEIKGVNMRSSNAPPYVNDAAKGLMCKIMDMQMEGKSILMKEVLGPVIAIENEIKQSILNGSGQIMNTTQIKGLESYTKGENEPAYKSWLLWEQVFAHKYGHVTELPYRAVKVQVDLPNKTAIREWVASIKDTYIREALTEWYEENPALEVKLFRVPKSIVDDRGIPEEIQQVVNLRGLTREIMKPFYYVLESCGLFMLNDKNTRLVTDEYFVQELEQMKMAA